MIEDINAGLGAGDDCATKPKLIGCVQHDCEECKNAQRTIDDLRAALATARQETIERCAKVCHDLGNTYFNSGGLGTNCADMCAKSILALTGEPKEM